MAQNKLITDLVALVTPNNDDVLVVVDNTTNPSQSITKKISYANLKESLQDIINLFVSGGTGIIASYNDAGNILTISVSGDTTVQRSIYSNAGSTVGTRRQLNLIPGASIAFAAADNSTDNRVDWTVRTTAVSTASNLIGSGTTFDTLANVATLGDGTKDLRLRTLKAASNKVVLALSDSGNAVSFDIVPSGISINDLNTASPLSINLGGTNATTASDARGNLGAAKAGDNSDITSLSGMTTPLSISQGGTNGNTSQVGLRNLQGLNSVTNVATAGQSLVVNASTLVAGNYRAELRGIRAGSARITVGVVSNDISINANADVILGSATQDVDFNGFKLTNVADPVSSTDVATKDYVDGVAQGLVVKETTLLATTSGQVGTYVTSGQTFTYTATGVPTIDGVQVTATGTRVLFKNQGTASQNGIYQLTTSGNIGVSAVFTRAFDSNSSAEVDAGTFAYVLSGSTNAGKQFVQTAQDPILDTDALAFTVLNDLTIPDNSVTNAKLEHMPAFRIKGTVASGNPQDLTADQIISVINSGGTSALDQARVTITGALDSNARLAVSVTGLTGGTRRKINFIPSGTVTISASDDAGNEEVDVTIGAVAAGGGVSLGLAVALG